MIKNNSFKNDLKTETLGANFNSKPAEANFRCVLFFHQNINRNITTITGITAKK
jgi:hypothetical protein